MTTVTSSTRLTSPSRFCRLFQHKQAKHKSHFVSTRFETKQIKEARQKDRKKERKKESQKRRRGENQLIELIESSSIGDLSVRWRKTARSRQHSFHGGSNDIAGKNNHHHHQLIIQDKKIKQTKTSKTRIKSSK